MKIQDIVGKKIAVNCKTEEEAERFLKLVKEAGGVWWHGNSIEENKEVRLNDCYELSEGILRLQMWSEKDLKRKDFQILDSTAFGEVYDGRPYTIGKKIDRKDVKAGMWLSCGGGDGYEPSGCWESSTKPQYIAQGMTKENTTIHHIRPNGRYDICSCQDLDHLYEVIFTDEGEEYTTPVYPFADWKLDGPMYITTKPLSFKKTYMENAIKFVRSLALNKDDKLLRELGFEDECGNPTPEGYQLSDELDYKRNRVEIIEIAKKMKTEQKKQ